MSVESKLWMGDLEEWMNEETIMKFFNEYNFCPKNIEMIKDEKNECFYNHCFINFYDIYEANEALIKLDGKKIPNANTNSTFKLKWAYPNSKSIDIYVSNLSPEIDNLELYNLFKGKYPSVHHASIITKNNISKGYGFVNFLDKKESEKCIKEMDGYIFYNKALKVKEKNNKNHKKSNYKKNNSEEDEDENEKGEFINSDKSNNFIKLIGILKGHNGPVTSLICSEDKNGVPLLFSGSEDTSIIKWKLFFKDNKFETNEFNNKKNELLGKPEKILKKHKNFITSLSFNSDNTKFISSSLDGKSILWNTQNLNPESVIKCSESGVLATCFGPNDRIIFSSENDKKLQLYNDKGMLRYIDDTLSGYVTCLLKIKRGLNYYIAAGLSDGKVLIFNDECKIYKEIPLYDKVKNNKDKLELKDEERYSVASLTVDRDGYFLFIGYRNGIIMVFKLFNLNEYVSDDEEENIAIIIPNGYKINNILYEDEFFQYIFIGDNKGFKINGVKGKNFFEDNNSGTCLSLCFDNHKKYLFAGFGNGIIKVYQINKNYD